MTFDQAESDFLKSRMSAKEFEMLARIESHSVLKFILTYTRLCNPFRVRILHGTDYDLSNIRETALSEGEERPLAIKGHTVHFENYGDQARDREHTIILVPKNIELGFGIRTGERSSCLGEMESLLRDIMKHRTLYVAFYCLGPLNSEFSIPCVQITDSSYVVHGENILYRQGYEEFIRLGKNVRPFKFVHSQGELDEQKTSKNLDKRRVYIDLEGETVFSVNTQYAGNVIGLKKLGMRLAISRASREGWLNEHMLIMAVHGPKGRRTYFTGAFPSMCGKTSTAMLDGETILGDDIAFLRKHGGSAYAVNAEKGIFGIIQGINSRDDPILWEILQKPGEAIFSNVLVTQDGGVYWEGKDGPVPSMGRNHSGEWWLGKKDAMGNEIPPSHPNARFNVPLNSFRNLDPQLNNPEGVKIEGIMYGGRDSDTSVPVQESLNWEHGIVTFGASLESESTAATLGVEGVREFNPMSNLDFLSIPITEYVLCNLEFGKALEHPPSIFGVNNFLRDKSGRFLNDLNDKKAWLRWMELRVNGDVGYLVAPTGRIPFYVDLKEIFRHVLGKDLSEESYSEQFKIRIPENLAKLDRIEKVYRGMDNAPSEIFKIFGQQRERLHCARKKHGDYIKPEFLSP